jgi:flagellar M-ring protein FliF
MASLDIAALVPARFRERIEPVLNGRWRTTLLAGGALALALLVVALLWFQIDSYSVLYAGLSAEEGGRAIADLQKENIPYRVGEGGRVILVPNADLGRARLQLATQGVPKQDADQWGLLDNESLGVSPFVEQVHYTRAIESMLSGTIRQVDGVVSARVALAVPKQTDFLADTPKPSASVMVRLRPGVQLTAAQIAGITGLVAAGVPGLVRDNVTIVDQSGKALSGNTSDALQQVPQQLAIAREIESRYEASVGALLMPVLGAGNFRVSAAADVDFSRTEESSIKYGGSHVLSQDETVHPPRDGADIAIGIPGALSNRPPPTPSVAPNPPNAATPALNPPNPPTAANPANSAAAVPTDGQPAQAVEKSASPPISDTHRTTNYDLDHTVEHQQHPSWTLRGLSVAVLLNHSSADATSADRIQSIKALVGSAVGIGDNRHIEVVDLPFAGSGYGSAEVSGSGAQPWMTAVAQNALIALAGLLLLLGGVSPILRRLVAAQTAMAQSFAGANVAFVGVGDIGRMGAPIGAPRTLAAPGTQPAGTSPPALSIDPETVRTLVLNQPGRTAQVIKGWIARDGTRFKQAG